MTVDDDGVSADAMQLGGELVSPGNTTMDPKLKPLLFTEAAIPHYWRLEFDPAPRLIISELDNGRCVETATALTGAVTQAERPLPARDRPCRNRPPGGRDRGVLDRGPGLLYIGCRPGQAMPAPRGWSPARAEERAERLLPACAWIVPTKTACSPH